MPRRGACSKRESELPPPRSRVKRHMQAASLDRATLDANGVGVEKRTLTVHESKAFPEGERSNVSLPPAQVMSDATESSDSTCEPSVSSAPLLRRRGSSWSLANNGGNLSSEKCQKVEESCQVPATGIQETPSVAQHEVVEHDPSEIESITRFQQKKETLIHRLTETSMRGNLALVNFSQLGLGVANASLIKHVISQNPHLSVLKLSYNNFGDEGTATIASAFVSETGHHGSLAVLDLGFNSMGEDGCAALALHAVAGNYVLRALCLTGNNINETGALSLAGAILHGSSLSSLHLTANKIGTVGVKALTRAVAESERRNQIADLGTGETKTDYAAVPTMRELHVGGTCMGSTGFLSVANMILTNFSLRVLCLSDNGIDDRDVALLSQSIGQNKNVPLEVLQLSFNQFSCVGTECLMNALWGSETLREMRLDHNRIKDRGAQLVAVVLTSMNLEVLDVGFNRIGSLGIKALMKSLSENSSLSSLTLSGIPIDPPSSKAVCYALAYNNSLQSLFLDSCSIGYSAQRHIVAGIVSNQHASLRVMTGFQLGAITVTLGLPEPLESRANDRVLTFVRFMWKRWRLHLRESNRAQRMRQGYDNEVRDNDEDQSLGTNPSSDGQPSVTTQRSEPADPKTVVAASKNVMSFLGEEGFAAFHSGSHDLEKANVSPLVPSNATLLQRSLSGTIRVPSVVQLRDSEEDTAEVTEHDEVGIIVERSSGNTISPESSVTGLSLDPQRRKRNAAWLRTYFWALSEIAQFPFDKADFLQLQMYFYSPVDDEFDVCHAYKNNMMFETEENGTVNCPHSTMEPSASLSLSATTEKSNAARQESDTRRVQNFSALASSSTNATASKRHSRELKDDDATANGIEPATKRLKNSKVRIAQYPRLWEELELHRMKDAQHQALVLLRQLKFVESELLKHRNGSVDGASNSGAESPSPSDVEMILMDLM